MAKMNSLTALQQALVQIIDTAALSDQMTAFAYDCLSSITTFAKTGRWENVNNKAFFDGNPQIDLLYNQLPTSDEIYRVGKRLQGFSYKSSNVWAEITRCYGPEVKHTVLKDIAIDIAHRLEIVLDRDAKRRKSVLIKWFEENWNLVQPLISEYQIRDDKVYIKSGSLIGEPQRKE